MNRTARRKISVLLVDDHAVVREGYRRLLERDDRWRWSARRRRRRMPYAATGN
jgi:DNA-binding NarL/FixJ family response regulator